MALSTQTPALPGAVAGMLLLSVGPALWRVVDQAGRAVGHVQVDEEAGGRRYIARRFRVTERAFRDVGAFWTLQEAIECLRLSR
ncbi:MAG: hypothetical protein EOO67_13025 [Microbacterium sp.]|nr:MAG: hypothetical protein EOO67_13025 [Microbacterium sp.]